MDHITRAECECYIYLYRLTNSELILNILVIEFNYMESKSPNCIKKKILASLPLRVDDLATVLHCSTDKCMCILTI